MTSRENNGRSGENPTAPLTLADLIGEDELLVADQEPAPPTNRVRKPYRLRVPELKSQADRVIDRFGSETQLWQAILAAGYHVNRSTVYRWRYPREKGGNGGIIPTRAWPMILAAARIEGIFLTPEDKDPAVQRTWAPYLRPHMVEDEK